MKDFATKTQRRRSERGSAIVEFALAATTLVYAFVGVFQAGYSMYLYNELTSAVRAGVRYGSLAKVSKAASSTTDPTAYDTAVKNVVVYGTPSPALGATPVVTGLDTTNVNVALTFDTTSSGNPPTYVTVNISNYQLNAAVKTITLTNKPTMKMAYMGQYCVISGSAC